MRMNRILLAVCAAAGTAVCAQTASAQAIRTGNGVGPISFNYDAQHDRVTADGVRMMASTGNTPITQTTGTIKVSIYVDVLTTFPKKTEVHCTVLAVGGILDTTNAIVAGGLETANVIATSVNNGMYACDLLIPYRWTLPPDPHADSGLIIAVGVSAIGKLSNDTLGGGGGYYDTGKSDDKGKGDDGGKGDDKGKVGVIRSTLQVGGVDALPKSGATTKFTINVAL